MATSGLRDQGAGGSVFPSDGTGGASGPGGTPAVVSLMDSSRTALRQGLIGAILLVVASIGVGWLAGSSLLIRTPLFIFARTSPVAVVVSTVLLCVGAILMLRAWLRLAQRLKGFPAGSRPVLIRAFWLWNLPLMVALPLFSRDAYAYIGQGRLMTNGLNPYTNGISALNNYFNLGPDTLWTEAPTPYGPLWLWIEQGAVFISGGVPEITLIPFRLAGLAGMVLLMMYIPRLAAHHGMNPDRALWLVALNPVVIVNFVASAHNDSLMLGLMVAGIYCASVKRPIWGIVLVTASIAIKPITLIALPFVGLLWAGHRAGWTRRFMCWTGTLVLSVVLLGAAGWVNGLLFGWLGALQTSSAVWIWYAPVGLFSHAAGWASSVIGLPGAAVTDMIQLVGTVLSIACVLWLTLRPATRGALGMSRGRSTSKPLDDLPYQGVVLRRMAWAFAAVVLLAPMIQPWYMIWLLALFTVTGIREGWQTRTVYYLTTFFVLIALTDQLSVFRWIPIELVRGVAIAVGASMALYLMFLDPKTHVLFRHPRKAKS